MFELKSSSGGAVLLTFDTKLPVANPEIQMIAYPVTLLDYLKTPPPTNVDNSNLMETLGKLAEAMSAAPKPRIELPSKVAELSALIKNSKVTFSHVNTILCATCKLADEEWLFISDRATRVSEKDPACMAAYFNTTQLSF
jgi:hypothetical protein